MAWRRAALGALRPATPAVLGPCSGYAASGGMGSWCASGPCSGACPGRAALFGGESAGDEDEDGRVGGESAAGGAAGGGGRRVLMEQTEEAGTEVGSLRPSFSEGRAEPAYRENIPLWSQPNPLLFRPNNRGDGSAPTWLVPLLNQTHGETIR